LDAATSIGGAKLQDGCRVGQDLSSCWKKKSFILPAADTGKRVYLDFDGVMARLRGPHLNI
jgi:hypothetical protein